jgi:hypothetical protein
MNWEQIQGKWQEDRAPQSPGPTGTTPPQAPSLRALDGKCLTSVRASPRLEIEMHGDGSV